MKKKRKVRTNWDRLYDKAYKLWREACFKRDGHQCQVQKRFPIVWPHDEILQVDHCITRDNKHFHLDPRNGTVVCRSCNGSKSWDKKSVGKLIDKIVKEREGESFYEHMVQIDSSNEPFLEFKTEEYMEKKIAELTKMMEV